MYLRFRWNELPLEMKRLAGDKLDLTQSTWDKGGRVPHWSEISWKDLPIDRKMAAYYLGYEQKAWDLIHYE